ncbi:hypothetical protein [Rhodopirellula sp. MGV]|uniref:hypothetical protein n=1 Tax=Rhodopirellula sp. MGV TaxID=2023130 RepID=UPI00117AEF2E|nr:hypothetical protein [Rhodopirellula sp. MGV]
MTTQRKRLMFAAALAASVAVPTVSNAQQVATTPQSQSEVGSNSPYYEDDAWYDITEWFDGNDYNPTDEAIGRWDDEKFQFSDNVTSSDSDNDSGSYTANKPKLSDPKTDTVNTSPSKVSSDPLTTNLPTSDSSKHHQYFERYDDGYLFWDDHNLTNYYDLNGDGLYDAMASYTDADGDGVYEEFDYVSLNEAGDSRDAKMEAMDKQKTMTSAPRIATGEIAQVNKVDVRDQQHFVATVNTDQGQEVVIDLGPTNLFKQMPEPKSEVTAEGLIMKVEGQPLLVAKHVELPHESVTVNRSGRSYQGTVEKIKTVTVHGQEHRLAKLKTKSDKNLMVDFGPSRNVPNLKEGMDLVVQGVPAKVKDRVVLLAREMAHNGEITEIDRHVVRHPKI